MNSPTTRVCCKPDSTGLMTLMQLTPAVCPLALSLYRQPSSVIRQYMKKDRVQTASVYALASILRKMLARLLFWGFIGEVAALQALHGHIGRGQQGAEGFGEHCIGLECI